MTVTLHSTDKIVLLKTESGTVPARIWEGTTKEGIACHAFITRIAHSLNETPENSAVFERELMVQMPPTAEVDEAYPLRLIL